MPPAARPADGHQTAGTARYLPILGWLHAYDRSWFAADTVAAISVWALLVPQSLAYATLAGVPVQYGLYTAFAALAAYAIFGTSRHVVQGPSASVAAVSAAIVAPLLAPGALGTDLAVPLTAALAITTGLVYICLSILRMGWIANFLSSAVMSGFILGFAIGIIIDQSYKLLGVDKTSGTYWDELVGTIRQIPDTNATTLAVGAASLAALLLMRRFAPKWPRALLVAVVSILAVKAFDLAADGVAVTGNVPTGMFSVNFPTGVWNQFPTLVAGAFAIIFVGISETLAAGRSMAARHHYTLDVDQEFAAQGFACAGAGLVGGFVNDGSLSKTSVADAAGQKSQMASVVNAVFVLLTILFLAALFEDLPSAALAAVVIDAMLGLIGFKAMARYWRVNKADFVFFMAAGLGIIFFSITQGIAVGVILSLLLLVARSSRPALRQLGRDPRSETYLDIRRHDDLVTDPHILVTRLDGPLFFADANRFHDDVMAAVTQRQDPLVGVVVDMESVAYTDTDGADILISLAAELRRAGIWFGIARAQSEIEDRWRLAGVFDAIGEHRLFPSVTAAVEGGEGDSSGGLSTPGAGYSSPDPPHSAGTARNTQESE